LERINLVRIGSQYARRLDLCTDNDYDDDHDHDYDDDEVSDDDDDSIYVKNLQQHSFQLAETNRTRPQYFAFPGGFNSLVPKNCLINILR
jgi:hypothetical protein